MKKRTKATLAAIVLAIVLSTLLYLCTQRKSPDGGGDGGQGGPSSIPTTLTYGNATRNCLGKGICKAIAAGQLGAPPGSIGVSFTQDATNPNVIYMSFSMPTLQAAPGQSEQVTNFSAPNTSYIFDVPYSISQDNPLFAKWRIPFNAVIGPNSSSHFGMHGNQLIDTITFSTSMPVTEFVVFGDTAGGGCHMNGHGICSISSVQTAGSIPVTFTLQSGNASNLLMSFNINSLAPAGQAAQVPYFQASTTYVFGSKFVFSDPSFAPLQIPQNATILPGATTKVFIDGTGNVTDTISYTTDPM